MTFKELKPGYPVYLLNKADMTAKTGKTVSVSVPHIDTKLGAPTQMVVDATVEFEGTPTTYCMIADAETAYPSGLAISTGREAIIREVQAIKASSEQALSQVDHYRETVKKCGELLAEMDPAIREKQETDERFSRIEQSLAKLAASIEHFVE